MTRLLLGVVQLLLELIAPGLFVTRQLLMNQGPLQLQPLQGSDRAAIEQLQLIRGGRQPEHRKTVPGLPGRLQRGGRGVYRGFAQDRLQACHGPRTRSTTAINPRQSGQLHVSCRTRQQI